MIAPLLLALACNPDVTTWAPTPTYRWDHPGDVAGFRIYWRNADRATGWDGSFDLPVEVRVNEDTGATAQWAHGWRLDYPVQRGIPGEGVEVRFVVRAFDASNVESAPSQEQALCLPLLEPRP